MKKNDNKGFKQLNKQQLSKIKGGYRQIPGTVAELNSFRWDDIAIRFNDDGDSSFGSGDPRVMPSSESEPTSTGRQWLGATRIS